jgi:hypothetical protein
MLRTTKSLDTASLFHGPFRGISFTPFLCLCLCYHSFVPSSLQVLLPSSCAGAPFLLAFCTLLARFAVFLDFCFLGSEERRLTVG